MRRRLEVLRVEWQPGMGKWVIAGKNGVHGMSTSKAGCVSLAKIFCNTFRQRGRRLELRVMTRAGRVQVRHRYA